MDVLSHICEVMTTFCHLGLEVEILVLLEEEHRHAHIWELEGNARLLEAF